ncbi:isochorismatase family cysteine hydrolase [Acinetobacter sp. V91_7]|uniref:isochorismatase family cysteine hydrolase n=1 Tax=Acinetobacter TaxID=469 RepID=UPI002275EA4A|nr:MULTISPECIES: isochorismatase family cysteine hydrolase [Acinetobacter]MDS7933272.1 isochorismatase family cysteine hydrolase [Acinetobacter sp. V91_4B]MDS7963497.1 isochorismatase family cysteine hydrolase [Acinetobacter sp. V91_7]MDS8027526.1 isochorismatase family cysteine hydrolase [Acinetobacter sp. V91_13]GLG81844.1 isochorismatase [Acinetobacter calcoaceticus]
MNTALIALDYILDISHPEGKIARSAQQVLERNVISHANRALTLAQQKDWLRILVKVGFATGYVDQPKHSRMFGQVDKFGALALDQPGTAFHPDLASELGELVIIKPRVSAFYGTNLDAALRARGIERLIICGVSSTWAVQSTVRDAHDRDYQVLVLEEACAAATPEEHQISMETLAHIAEIVTLEDLKGR